MAIIMMLSIKVFQDHFCTTGIWTRILYYIFDDPDDVGNDGNDDNNDDEDDAHRGYPRLFLHNEHWTGINDSKTFLKFWVYFFYEPDDNGNMTKVVMMVILIIIVMVLMIMLIFLHAKVFQVALNVGLLLLDLTHFTQI